MNFSNTLLILTGGVEAVEGIKTAKNMNLNVIVMDGNRRCLGRKQSDEFLHANIYDPDAVVNALRKYKYANRINGVVTIAADNTTSVAAAIEYLGLAGITKNAAKIATNKLIQKQVLLESGINIPWFSPISNIQQLHQIFNLNDKPYVLKPLGSRGSRGVIRINKKEDIDYAYNYSKQYATTDKKLLLEEWLEGPQLSVEAIVYEGEIYLCGVADRNYNLLVKQYPFVIENGGETPSIYSPAINSGLKKLFSRVAKAIGIKNGSIKGDIVYHNKELFIIEVAARLSGGYWSTFTIPKVYNINIVREVIRIALRIKPKLPKWPLENIAWQANRFLFPPEGEIIEIDKKNVQDSNIDIFNIYVKKGDTVPMITDHTKRSGMVLSISNSRHEAIRKCETAINSISIVTKKNKY